MQKQQSISFAKEVLLQEKGTKGLLSALLKILPFCVRSCLRKISLSFFSIPITQQRSTGMKPVSDHSVKQQKNISITQFFKRFRRGGNLWKLYCIFLPLFTRRGLLFLMIISITDFFMKYVTFLHIFPVIFCQAYCLAQFLSQKDRLV